MSEDDASASASVSTGAERRLRVVLLATYFPHPGNELMGTWALEQAAALVRADVDLTVVSLTSWLPRSLGNSGRLGYLALCPERVRFGDVEVHYPRWPYYNDRLLRYVSRSYPQLFLRPALAVGWGRLRDVITKLAPDVVVAHHACRSGFVAARIRKRLGIPYIVIDHDLEEISTCATQRWRRRLYETVYGSASAVVAVSRAMKSTILSLFPDAPVEVLYNGTSAACKGQAHELRPAELRGRLVVATVAMFYERKGIPLLIEAFAALASQFPEAVLRIVGDGPDRELIEASIAAHGLSDRVVLRGALPRVDALREMAWADVFSLAGWNEPFGVVGLEAMAMGTAAVFSRDAGVCELLVDGRHALMVEPRDAASLASALRRLLDSAELRNHLVSAALAHVEDGLSCDARALELKRLAYRVATGVDDSRAG